MTFASRLLSLGLLLLATVPSRARADLPISDRLEFGMYGRVGIAYSLDGRVIQGTRLNLRGSAIGGRFEESDYLEPTLKFYIVKPETERSTGVRLVMTPAMFARTSLIGFFSTFTVPNLTIELFQAYVEATNVILPGLSVWGGQRFYRGEDVHIADYFYFNNLSSQGGGVRYKDLDFALLVQTGSRTNAPAYQFDENGDGTPDAQRQRLVFVSQYVHRFPQGGEPGKERAHKVHLLAELHALPAGRTRDGTEVLPSDSGWVLGAKGVLDFGNGNFSSLSVRYGRGIANGSIGGAQTWGTFGTADTSGHFSGAYGLEIVEHFVFNVSPLFAVNGYGILNLSRGGGGTNDRGFDTALGARTFLYLHDNFHLVNEVTYQTRQDGHGPIGDALKLTVAPTIVPTGKRSVWERPHYRLFYTVAFYDRASRDALMSPYHQAFGPDAIAHYLGARVEWWF